MSAPIVIASCAAVFLIHAWLLLGHRQIMGSEAEDHPHDPIFTRKKLIASFLSITTVQILSSYRRILIAIGTWNTETAWRQFLDFLPLPANSIIFIVGWFFVALGLALRLWSIRLLGRLFTFEIGIRAKHQIIEKGPYRFIRHPSYSGYLLMLVGMGLIYASLFSLLGMCIGTFLFLALRIHQEERMLVEHFGESYKRYIARTKRLIPFLY